MNKSFPLTKDTISQINAVLEAVLALDDKKKHVVNIAPATTSLSAQQRKYYFACLRVIGAELGDSVDYYHSYFKGKYLMGIYERSSDDFANMVETIREMHRGGDKTNAVFLHEQIVKMVSITDASVNQMVAYMDAIIKDVGGLGITVPKPDNRNVLEYRELKDEN